MTDHPLLEEYSICRIFWSFSNTDLSEIARNSVLQSGYSHERKKEWLGQNYWKEGLEGNDPNFSNVPNIRVAFREDVHKHECEFVKGEHFEEFAPN
jgi:AMP deaminase